MEAYREQLQLEAKTRARPIPPLCHCGLTRSRTTLSSALATASSSRTRKRTAARCPGCSCGLSCSTERAVHQSPPPSIMRYPLCVPLCSGGRAARWQARDGGAGRGVGGLRSRTARETRHNGAQQHAALATSASQCRLARQTSCHTARRGAMPKEVGGAIFLAQCREAPSVPARACPQSPHLCPTWGQGLGIHTRSPPDANCSSRVGSAKRPQSVSSV